MPRTLKRRSDAISRDEEDSLDATPGLSTQRRNRSPSASSADANSASDSAAETGTQSSNQTANIQTLAKKLIRLALSSEYSRSPIRRTDIAQKVFKESNASPRLFKQVFTQAQKQLSDIFGMQMAELPSREKTTLKDRRTQTTQTNSTAASKSQSWVLVSTLPQPYKTQPAILQPTLAPSQETEASYTALYTFILSLIFLNNSSLPEAKLDRYLKRVNADTYTPSGSLDKLLQRMVKEGYIDKRRDTTSGEEITELIPGPRGKVEVGVNGVAGLVRAVYGFGTVRLDGNQNSHQGQEDQDSTGPPVEMDRDELEQRLKRSLGTSLKSAEPEMASIQDDSNPQSNTLTDTDADTMELDPDHPSPHAVNGSASHGPKRSTRRQRRHVDEDDSEDDSEDDDDDAR